MVIDFVITQNNYTFSDALILPDDHTFTDVELEAMKQARLDNWIAAITAPVEEVPVEEVPVEAQE
jgi:hypothetical protein